MESPDEWTMESVVEVEDSINMGNFLTDMTGWPNQPTLVRLNDDLPGSYHGQAGGLSFAEGHSEIRHWKDPRTVPPIHPDVNASAGTSRCAGAARETTGQSRHHLASGTGVARSSKLFSRDHSLV
jgi:hypothetical protein